MYKRIISGLMAALTVMCFTACSTAKTFQDYVAAGDYLAAIEAYKTDMFGNATKELEAENYVRQYMQETLDRYAKGDLDVQKTQSVFDCLSKIDEELYILDMDLTYTLGRFADIQDSKTMYSQGVEFMEAEGLENDLNALWAFMHVDASDTENYEQAQGKRDQMYSACLDDMAAYVDEMIVQNKFEEAKDMVEDNDIVAMIEVLGDDGRYQALRSRLFEKWEEFTLNSAAEMIEQNKFEEAKNLLEGENIVGIIEILGDDGDYQTLRDKLFVKWEESVANAAAEAFWAGTGRNYEAAIQVLQSSGLQGEKIDHEIEKYQEYVPVRLTSLDYTHKTGYMNVGTAPLYSRTDLAGTEYEPHNIICPKYDALDGAAKTEEKGYVSYYLNAGYSRLTGLLYIPGNTLACTAEQWAKPTTVKIYGDNVLLYEAPSLSRENLEPISIDLNITGVRELRIVMLGVWEQDRKDYSDHYPKVCAANFEVSK